MVEVKILKRGQVAVDKKRLINLTKTIHAYIDYMDKLMKEEKDSLERGKKIAKAINKLQFDLHVVEHFDLGIDLKKLK